MSDVSPWPLETPLTALQLSVRTFNVLHNNMGCKTVGDVIDIPEQELLRQHNFGRKSLNELRDRLKKPNDDALLKYADKIRELSEQVAYWKGRAEGMERIAEILGVFVADEDARAALAKARGTQ